ncbi:unnamed protein product [Rodentolepis nana]|uniref:G_PROTEIN_RECEP_F1_2 domain-containing protein n=1 Tax=Rodentolepis nana TaxID=102285 RepID=A0A0R3TRN9_RODNA|nr:unnamed protein product [Rodentolepis nana]
MDVYEEIIDPEANEFYDNVRTFIVVFLTVACLLPTSYVLLNSRRKIKEAYLSKEDVTVQNFVLLVSMSIVSLCIIMVFMLPLSILANEVLILFPDRYYVQWINAGLLHAFFVLVRIAFKGSCFVIPFSFFLMFSHTANKGNKGLWSRCFYSMLYVVVTYIASFGCLTVFVSTILVAFNSSNLTSVHGSVSHFLPRACFSSPNFYFSWPVQLFGDIICSIDSILLRTQQSISYIGLSLLLVCMPSGICGLILKMISFSHSTQTLYQPSSIETYNTDCEYQFLLEKCSQYIKTLNEPFHQHTDQYFYQIGAHSDISYRLSLDETEPPIKLNEAPLRRTSSVLSTVAFVFLMIVFIASVISTSVNIIAMLYSLLIPRGEETADRSSFNDYIILGHESVSKFGFFGAFLQVSCAFGLLLYGLRFIL